MFDSLTIMFSTISTGGFSPHSESIAYFHNPLVEWIVIIFMFLGGTSFYLHYQSLVSRNWRTYWRNVEFRGYVMVIAGATLVSVVLLWGKAFNGIEAAVRTSLFQVLSCMTSTGFATQDFIRWDEAMVFLLFALIFIGGCTGSTAGGLKVARFLISRRFISSSLYKTVHPKAIFSIKLDGRALGESVLSSVIAVILCYLATALVCTAALMLTGIAPMTAVSAAVTTLSNAGPGLGQLGPLGTFAGLSDPAKMVLIFTMWAGRLEFLTVFAVMTPVFWRELLRYRD